MNSRIWHITTFGKEKYCEVTNCPRIRGNRQGGKRCDGKCPKKGTVIARIGVKRSRRESKEFMQL